MCRISPLGVATGGSAPLCWDLQPNIPDRLPSCPPTLASSQHCPMSTFMRWRAIFARRNLFTKTCSCSLQGIESFSTPNPRNMLSGRSITNHLDFLRDRDGEGRRRCTNTYLCHKLLSPTLTRSFGKPSNCNLQRLAFHQKPKDPCHRAFISQESPELLYFFCYFLQPVLFTSRDTREHLWDFQLFNTWSHTCISNPDLVIFHITVKQGLKN